MDGTMLGMTIALLFPIAFGIMWCGVLFLLSRVSGWSRLAQFYARSETPEGGTEFRWQTGMVGVVSYRNCLHIRVLPSGLWLSVAFPLSVGHQRLFIPWTAVHGQQDGKFLWHEVTRFDVGHPPQGRVRLPSKVFAAQPGAA